MEELNKDVLFEIALNANRSTLNKLCKLNKYYRNLCKSEYFWSTKYKKDVKKKQKILKCLSWRKNYEIAIRSDDIGSFYFILNNDIDNDSIVTTIYNLIFLKEQIVDDIIRYTALKYIKIKIDPKAKFFYIYGDSLNNINVVFSENEDEIYDDVEKKQENENYYILTQPLHLCHVMIEGYNDDPPLDIEGLYELDNEEMYDYLMEFLSKYY